MTKPTPRDDLYRWHTQALKDIGLHLVVTVTDEPQCGWFKRRLVKGGPFVPARIWIDQPTDPETGDLVDDEIMRCEVNGTHADPLEQWLWLCGDPISEADFKYMTAQMRWTGWYSPGEPMANPRQPVDWLKVPTPQFTKEPMP